ncbi:ADP-ribosylation factor-like 15 [Crotalus adamanteus]|uniref:ADP-ribosylation factor-like 15 n=1 Tax=Crotalus adamanteus TaxID=8729 RepID=A0AAW1C4C5_CROAD
MDYLCFRALCCKGPPPPRPEYDLVCIGLSGSGKTSLLSQLCSENRENIVSTTGFSIKAVPFQNAILNVKELGGADNIRKYWSPHPPSLSPLLSSPLSADEAACFKWFATEAQEPGRRRKERKEEREKGKKEKGRKRKGDERKGEGGEERNRKRKERKGKKRERGRGREEREERKGEREKEMKEGEGEGERKEIERGRQERKGEKKRRKRKEREGREERRKKGRKRKGDERKGE